MKTHTLFGSTFSHDALALHVGRTTWRDRFVEDPMLEPVPC